jgi:glucose-1-phosphate cytidylyltransferase
MQAMILCGGMGTRLREETEYRPKPMVDVGGRPILWHIMRSYARAGVGDFVLCLGYKGWMIKEYFLNYRAAISDVTITLGADGPVEFHTPDDGIESWRITCAETGLETQTGGRVRKALKYVTSDTFCLTYGDGVSDVDIADLLRFHRSHGRVATLTAVRASGRFGELSIGAGRVSEFREKPDSERGYINGGFFVFDTERLRAYLSGDDELVLEREPLEALAADNELMAYEHDGFWQCMDTFREWKILNDLWISGSAPWAR